MHRLISSITVAVFPTLSVASYGQMKLCRGFLECGLLAAVFFGILGIPVSVALAIFLFRKFNPDAPRARRRGMGLLIGVACYLLAVFSVSLMNELLRVPFKFRFEINVSAFMAFLLVYTALASWRLAGRKGETA